MLAKIREDIHLGDKIASCVIVHNIARVINVKIELCGCSIIETIVKNLGFDDLLKIKKESGDEFEKFKLFAIKDFLPNIQDTKVIFLSRGFIFLEDNFLLEKVQLPVVDVSKKEDVAYFQFDCRSEHLYKKNITHKKQLSFLKKNAKYEPIGIGGKDTQKNLPYDYFLSDLKSIIEKLKKSKQFVGVDSGISHLCGVLGIPSNIIITHNRPKDIKDIFYFYKMFYPKAECKNKLIMLD